jgi:hypothetical protein
MKAAMFTTVTILCCRHSFFYSWFRSEPLNLADFVELNATNDEQDMQGMASMEDTNMDDPEGMDDCLAEDASSKASQLNRLGQMERQRQAATNSVEEEKRRA